MPHGIKSGVDSTRGMCDNYSASEQCTGDKDAQPPSEKAEDEELERSEEAGWRMPT